MGSKYKLSESTREKMRNNYKYHTNQTSFKKGRVPWNKGLKYSEDERVKKNIDSGWKKTQFRKGFHNCDEDEWKENQSNKMMMNNFAFKQVDTSYRLPVRIRRIIITRDKNFCFDCGNINSDIIIHHVIPFNISKNNSINNLITLCRSCHENRHIKIRSGEQVNGNIWS